MYKFKATNLISDEFDKRELKYFVIETNGMEEVNAAFSVANGPSVLVKYISCDDSNAVSVRVFGLISVTKEKRLCMMEVCNSLNRKIRALKFYIDVDGDINVEYDFGVETSDDSIGPMAVEFLSRIMQVLDSEFESMAKTLYLENDTASVPFDAKRISKEFRESWDRYGSEEVIKDIAESFKNVEDDTDGFTSFIRSLQEDE